MASRTGNLSLATSRRKRNPLQLGLVGFGAVVASLNKAGSLKRG
jgi:hypothetical protein